MTATKHKLFTIFTILSVCGLLVLGKWQIDRMNWKDELIAKISAANKGGFLPEIPANVTEWKALAFRQATIRGEYLYEHEFRMAARYFRSTVGFHLYTPFALEDGRYIVVNRGWVPNDKKEKESREDTFVTGPQTLTVQFRTDRDHNTFTPKNQPDRNIWFFRDLTAMSEKSGLPLIPVAVDLVAKEQSRASIPVASLGKIKLRNDHMGYAVTWMGIAVGILAFYFLGHYTPYRRNQSAQSDT